MRDRTIARYLGPSSPRYQREIDSLTEIYSTHADEPSVQVKRQLWEHLLRAALGEIEQQADSMDDLFIRHTYLSAVVGMAVQASFGIDLAGKAEANPADLLHGRGFRDITGLAGVVESDFFAWPAETGHGLGLCAAMARRLARFDWANASADMAAILYETVIPAEERRQLGEYYPPKWLAEIMVTELVDKPLEQQVLDPACGSGTFLVAAVEHYARAAEAEGRTPQDTLDGLRQSVSGLDVHPVAVHLARASWVLAARETIRAAEVIGGGFTVPVHLGDALQLRYHADELFSNGHVTIETRQSAARELVFPTKLVERGDVFDALMADVAEAIGRGQNPLLNLDDHGITNGSERDAMTKAIEQMQDLHAAGRDHIWAYYTRKMVRPVVLARLKVDVIIGNPPCLTYSKTSSLLRDEIRRLSVETYGIWSGGRYATHQDVAGLFFSRAVDLYLRDNGVAGMVLPHSALQAGQYEKWRTGLWDQNQNQLFADLAWKTAWDLGQLEPNTFFPVAACVVFARQVPPSEQRRAGGRTAKQLANRVERWRGLPGSPDMHRIEEPITGTWKTSPYKRSRRNGATIFPRCLFLVEPRQRTARVTVAETTTITVQPRRSSQAKEPWKSLSLPSELVSATLDRQHVHDVHLGETIAPFVTLEPLLAALPAERVSRAFPTQEHRRQEIERNMVDPAATSRRMRNHWQIISELWENNKSSKSNLNLMEQIDYHGKLSTQLAWQANQKRLPVRLVYTSAGAPTAAILPDNDAIVDSKLFWMACVNRREACYLAAIINSETLAVAVNPYTVPNWSGKTRDLQKHLWKLPIPEYDGERPLHRDLALLGKLAERQAGWKLDLLRRARGPDVSVRIVRRELRAWLQGSLTGAAIDSLVNALLIENDGPACALDLPERPFDFTEVMAETSAVEREWKQGSTSSPS